MGLVEAYVDELARSLEGPRRVRRGMVEEVRGGLTDAVEGLEAAGVPRGRAERIAVEEFGAVAGVASGFQEELAVGQGRRTAVLLFLSVPMISLLWAMIWQVFPEAPSLADKPWWFVPVARTLDVSQMLTGVLGGAALVALRRGARGKKGRARSRRITRALGWLVWGHLPFTVVMSAALSGAGGDGLSAYPPGVLAAAVSLAVTTWQLRSATRCLILTRTTHPISQ